LQRLVSLCLLLLHLLLLPLPVLLPLPGLVGCKLRQQCC
jgi:hypothetical protein